MTGVPEAASEPEQPLSGVRVLDCTRSVAGAFCAKLLADFGADTVLVEDESGSALRRRGPVPTGAPPGTSGGLFAWLATNRTSVVVPRPALEQRLRELARLADILVVDRDAGLPEGFAASLVQGNPSLIVVDMAPFGHAGPYRDYLASRLVKMALSGWLHLVGIEGREPLATRGEQLGECYPGVYAALAALACLLRRSRSGQGEHIRVSEVEGLLSTNRYWETVFSYVGTNRGRMGAASGTAYGIFTTRDGAIGLGIAGHPGQWQRLSEIIGRPDLIDHEKLGAFVDNPVAHGIIAGWFQKQETLPAFVRLQEEAHIPAGPVVTGEVAPHMPQHIDREFIQTATVEGLGEVHLPGSPARLRAGSWRLRQNAPARGAGGERAIAAWRGRPRVFCGTSHEDADGELPLAGVRIVEVDDWWAGPYCGMLLGDLGADVIKIESPTRLDVYRTTLIDTAHPKSWETGPLYNAVNRNKRHLALDLKRADGVAAWNAVLRHSDALVENFTPRVVESFGFDYTRALEENPGLIFASISGFGQTGPWRGYRANAVVAEATGLVSAMTGYEDGPPLNHGVMPGDTSAGSMAALGIVVALLDRARTGRGQRVDCAQMETLTAMMGHSVVAASILPEPWGRAGNADETDCPSNVYPCAGDDQWIAISVRDEQQWAALCEAIGRREWLADGGLAHPAGRRARRKELDAAVAAWTRAFDKGELMRSLQATGVPAGAVLSPAELLVDEHHTATGFYRYVEREHAACHAYYSPAVRLLRSELGIRVPAPLFGQHTVEVLREVAGLPEGEIDRLLADKVCSTDFIGEPILDYNLK